MLVGCIQRSMEGEQQKRLGGVLTIPCVSHAYLTLWKKQAKEVCVFRTSHVQAIDKTKVSLNNLYHRWNSTSSYIRGNNYVACTSR
jgi:hypothetical protein